MAKIVRDQMAHRYDEEITIWSYLYSFFNRISSPLLQITHGPTGRTEGWVNILVDNAVNVKIYADGDRTTGLKVDDVARGDTIIYYAGSHPITVVYSDTFFWLDHKGASLSTYYSFLYEKIGNGRYASLNVGSSLSGFTLNELSEQVLYTHGVELNYECQPNELHYTDDYLFSGGLITDIKDTNILQCSQVTFDKVVTFSGKNYYSIGSNGLILLD